MVELSKNMRGLSRGIRRLLRTRCERPVASSARTAKDGIVLWGNYRASQNLTVCSPVVVISPERSFHQTQERMMQAGRLSLPPVNLRGLRQSSKPRGYPCDHLTHYRRGNNKPTPKQALWFLSQNFRVGYHLIQSDRHASLERPARCVNFS
jgi:hypothetical protein